MPNLVTISWKSRFLDAPLTKNKKCFFTYWPWPLTLTFSHALDITCVHHHAKFGDYILKITFFWHGDLDLWPLTLTFTHALDITCVHHHAKFGDCMSTGSREINFYPVTFCPVTDRQTDRKRCIRAHRAYAQVCSNIILCSVKLYCGILASWCLCVYSKWCTKQDRSQNKSTILSWFPLKEANPKLVGI